MSDKPLTDKYAELLYCHEESHPLVDVLNHREAEADVAYDKAELCDAPLQKGGRMDMVSTLGNRFSSPDRKGAEANARYTFGNDRGFGDDGVPFTHIKEKPWHRALAYLAAQGLNAREQCEKFGGQFDDHTNQYIAGSGQYAYSTILQINRQPWFKQRVIDSLREAGADMLGAWLESEVMPSLETLKNLRDNASTPATVRLASSRELLDRFLGKPTQPYTRETDAKDPEKEAAELEQEIARLSAETKPPATSAAQ